MHLSLWAYELTDLSFSDSSQCCFSPPFALMYKSRARNKDERAEEQMVMGQGTEPCKATQKGFPEEVLFESRPT